MSEDKAGVWQRMFPWLSRNPKGGGPTYTAKYRIDSANSMHIILYEDGKRLYKSGYLLWSNLTWARLWTPWYIWKAKRARKRDERMALLNKRTDMDVKHHHRDRFYPYPDQGDW